MALVVGALSAAVAVADPPACPTRPADADAGASAEVVELRALRQELADACAVAREDALVLKLAVEDATATLHGDAGEQLAVLEVLRDHEGDPVVLALGGDAESPLFVQDADAGAGASTVALAQASMDELHADQEQQRFALWFGCGLLLVLLVERIFRRVWLP